MVRSRLISGITTLVLMAAPAWAAPKATLSFQDPTGTVAPTDAIPVYVTLTLAPDSDAIITGENGEVISGFDASDLPEDFVVTTSRVNQSFQCSGNFTSSCTSGPPYAFSFNNGGAFGDGFSFKSNLNLQPGTTTTFLFGTFTPSHGPVAEGTYTYFNTAFFMQLEDHNQADPGSDAGTIPWAVDVPIASTCGSGLDNCSFQRTVVAAVPEPQIYATLLAGLVLIGWLSRRRA